MKYYLAITNITAAIALAFAISACSTQEEMVAKPAAKPAAPAPAAKTEAKLKLKPRQRLTRRQRQPSWRVMSGYWIPKKIT